MVDFESTESFLGGKQRTGDDMLMGKYNHTIDTKGRLIVPSKFRDEIGEQFVITRGLDGCLFAYDLEEWKVFEDKLKQLPSGQKDVRTYARFFLGEAALVEIDKQGRILVPANLRTYAELDKDVVVVGVLGRMEIWSQAKWDAEDEANGNIEQISENLASMGLSI